MTDVLVIDDEVVLARSIAAFLERRGFSSAFAVDQSSAKAMLLRERPRLVILDLRLGHDNGLDLLSWTRAAVPEAQVVIMTGHGDVPLAVQAMKRGARDFLVKPAPLATIAGMAADLVWHQVTRSTEPWGIERIIGRSSATIDLRASLRRLAAAAAGTDPPSVLVTGPRGSGKALVARVLYEMAQGARGDLAVVDASLGEGPLADRLRSAPDGLLLRNIDRLSPEAQAGLMAALSGGRSPWLLATTSANLPALERHGGFRSDLLYRVQVGWIEVPALAERSFDILPLAEEFGRRKALALNGARPCLTSEARARLLDYDWPGDVAELESCIERAVIHSGGDEEIGLDKIRLLHREVGDEMVPKLLKQEETALMKALRVTGGNVSRAARMLGISRDTLRYRMEKFGIPRR